MRSSGTELAEYLYGCFGFDYHVELEHKAEKSLARMRMGAGH